MPKAWKRGPPSTSPMCDHFSEALVDFTMQNWGEIGQKLKRLISLFDQMQGKGVLTNLYWCDFFCVWNTYSALSGVVGLVVIVVWVNYGDQSSSPVREAAVRLQGGLLLSSWTRSCGSRCHRRNSWPELRCQDGHGGRVVAPTSPWLGAPVLWVLLLDVSLHVRPVTTNKPAYISDRTSHLRSLCKVHQLLSSP